MSGSRSAFVRRGLLGSSSVVIAVLFFNASALSGLFPSGTVEEPDSEVRISAKALDLQHRVLVCQSSSQPELCLDNVALRYPPFEPDSGLVAVRFRSPQYLGDGAIQEWQAGLPEELFAVEVILHPKRTTLVAGWADAARLTILTKFFDHLFDAGLLDLDGVTPEMFNQTELVATETWILPNHPDLTATDCVDPEIHHGYLSRGRLYDPALLQVLSSASSLPGQDDLPNDELDDVFLHVEHECASGPPGASDLCDVLHDNIPSTLDPLRWGLVHLWEGDDFDFQVSLHEEDFEELLHGDDEIFWVTVWSQLSQFGEVTEIKVSGSLPVIGARESARTDLFEVQHDYLRASLLAHALVVPDEPLVITVYLEDSDIPAYRFELSYQPTIWNLSQSYELLPQEDVETLWSANLGGNLYAMPLDDSIEITPPTSTTVSLQDAWVDPGQPATASGFAALDPGIPSDGNGLEDAINTILLGGWHEVLTPFLDPWLEQLVDAKGGEWSVHAGALLGAFAFEVNNRVGGEPQSGYEGILGIGAARAARDWNSSGGCASADPMGDFNEVGMSVVLVGDDSYFPNPFGDEGISSFEGENVGWASWVAMSADNVAELDTVKVLQARDLDDPGLVGWYYQPNPVLERPNLASFLRVFVENAIDTGVPNLFKGLCDDQFAGWSQGAISACQTDICGELAGPADRANCELGCLEYFDQVGTAWSTYDQDSGFASGICAQPDYLYTDKAQGTVFCMALDPDQVTPIDIPHADLLSGPRPIRMEPLPPSSTDVTTNCNCHDYNLEQTPGPGYLLSHYFPPPYLEADYRGDILVHIPLGVNVDLQGVEVSVVMQATENGCPVVPVREGLVDIMTTASENCDDDPACTAQNYYEAWFQTHAYFEEGAADALQDAQDDFIAYDTFSATQFITGDVTVYMTFEWVFPLRFDRQWQWAPQFWADNAYPADIFDLEPARSSVGLRMYGIDAAFFLDQGGSNYQGVGPFTANDVAGMVGDLFADPYENLLIDQLQGSLNLGSVSDSFFPFYSPDMLGWLASEYASNRDQSRQAVAMALRDLHTGEIGNSYVGDFALPPADYTAMRNAIDPMDQWLIDVLNELEPGHTMMLPRWTVLDQFWRQEVTGATPDVLNASEAMIATLGDTLELVDSPVVDEWGSVVDPDTTWTTSEGVAAWLLFDPRWGAYEMLSTPPCEWSDRGLVPPAYTYTGFQSYKSTVFNPWGQTVDPHLEEPACLPEWNPGRP